MRRAIIIDIISGVTGCAFGSGVAMALGCSFISTAKGFLLSFGMWMIFLYVKHGGGNE